MMAAMTINPTGDVDRDFAAMMIPHHQGAIDMAQSRTALWPQRATPPHRAGNHHRPATGNCRDAPGAWPTAAAIRAGTRSSDVPTRADDEYAEGDAMIRTLLAVALVGGTALSGMPAWAGQAPGSASAPDIAVSHHDRVYAAEHSPTPSPSSILPQYTLLGVIRLGDPSPMNFSPLYKGQVLVHGMGFSPDHRTIAVVSIGSNSVTFIDTATNTVKHTTYVGRAPHEAFFTPDGKEVWVTVRGENYVDVLDGHSLEEKTRITTPNGPGMQIFSPDGNYGYVCSSFNPEVDVVTVADHKIVERVKQASPVLPEHRGDTGWHAGLVHPERYRQDAGLRREAALRRAEGARYRADHQPRQYRTQRAWPVRLCHGRRSERGAGVSHQRLHAKSPPLQSANCRMESGPLATAAASMSAWRTMTAWSPSTPSPTR